MRHDFFAPGALCAAALIIFACGKKPEAEKNNSRTESHEIAAPGVEEPETAIPDENSPPGISSGSDTTPNLEARDASTVERTDSSVADRAIDSGVRAIDAGAWWEEEIERIPCQAHEDCPPFMGVEQLSQYCNFSRGYCERMCGLGWGESNSGFCTRYEIVRYDDAGLAHTVRFEEIEGPACFDGKICVSHCPGGPPDPKRPCDAAGSLGEPKSRGFAGCCAPNSVCCAPKTAFAATTACSRPGQPCPPRCPNLSGGTGTISAGAGCYEDEFCMWRINPGGADNKGYLSLDSCVPACEPPLVRCGPRVCCSEGSVCEAVPGEDNGKCALPE